VPDQRAIRYYTTIGLVDRPSGMRGRTALYGRRHLLQLVAIKRLQAGGLSLVDVQRELAGATDAQLERVARVPGGAAAPAPAGTAGRPARAAAPPPACWRRAGEAPAPPPAGRGGMASAAEGPMRPAGAAEPAGAVAMQAVRLEDGVTLLLEGPGPLGPEVEALAVRARITGLLASTVLTQTFVNRFGRPLEATYVFPLPDRAAVTSFRMEIGERLIEGTLHERAEARAAYDQALAVGRLASIVEEDRPGVFTTRVGNLPPGERATVRLELLGPLPYDQGEATFRFPLVVAPRYIPGQPLGWPPAGNGVQPDTDAVPDASRITPPVLLPGFPSPVGLDLEAEIDPAGLPLEAVGSSLHAVVGAEREGPGGPVRVIKVQPGARPDRDFVLRLRLGSGGLAPARRSGGGGRGPGGQPPIGGRGARLGAPAPGPRGRAQRPRRGARSRRRAAPRPARSGGRGAGRIRRGSLLALDWYEC
jgi:Vault protein inter-alpha-trypsin domain/MerR HTH family regulatory protein